MISYKVTQCKLFSQTKFSVGLLSTSGPVLFEKYFVDFSSLNSYLTTYFPFNNSFYDLAVNKLSIFYGSYTYTFDRFNQPKSAIQLNNGYLYTYNFYSSIRLPYNSGYTIALWIKIRAIGENSRLFNIFDYWTEGLSLGLSNSTSGKPFIYSMSNSSSLTIISTSALIVNKWQHLAFTFDPSGIVRIFINGIITVEGSMILPKPISPTQYFGYLGYDYYYRTNATLDDFKIFNKSLTQSEIMICMNS